MRTILVSACGAAVAAAAVVTLHGQPVPSGPRPRAAPKALTSTPTPGRLATAREDSLAEGFRNPPDVARPRVWWHWMDGNITRPGIKLDLEWLPRQSCFPQRVV